MARKRTISQSVAVLAGPYPATGSHGSNLTTFWGIQSANLSWQNQKEDIQVYGLGSPIGRETINPPEVTLDLSYLVTSNYNELQCLGLNQDGDVSVLADILSGLDERNYFIFVAAEGQDAVGQSGASSNIGVIGIGNGFLSSYSIEAAVGGFPTASVQIQALNWKNYTGGVNQPIPAVDPTTGLEITGQLFTVPTIQNVLTAQPAYVAKVIKPGDIIVSLADAGGIFYDYNSICAQSVRISFDLNRQPQNCLGSKFTTSRDLSFPININFEVDMIAKDIKTGSLAQYLCDTGRYSATVKMNLPACGGTSSTVAYGLKMNNMSLEGQELTTSVGSESQILKTTWIAQLGGVGDTLNGVFASGTFTG